MLTPTSSRPDVPPGYGLTPSQDGEGLLPWSWAEERLAGRHIWWLATTRPDGRPHLMPIWAVWLGDGVGFGTDAASRKAKNLAHNPHVSIIPERGTQSVILEGVAEPLAAERAEEFFAEYKRVWDTDVSGMGAPSFLVRPTTVFGFIDEDENGYPLSATRWTFE